MRLIDADTFNHFDYSCFDGQLSEDAIQGMDTVLNVIDTAPTIDAAPVRHGHWIENHYMFYVFGENYKPALNVEIDYKCNICNKDNEKTTDYCPNCGAKMDEVSE